MELLVVVVVEEEGGFLGDFLDEREDGFLPPCCCCCWPRIRAACSLRFRSFSVCDSDFDLAERCACIHLECGDNIMRGVLQIY